MPRLEFDARGGLNETAIRRREARARGSRARWAVGVALLGWAALPVALALWPPTLPLALPSIALPLVLAAALAYPLAFRAGFLSLDRERRLGTLDQILLTGADPRAILAGKAKGVLDAWRPLHVAGSIAAALLSIAALAVFFFPVGPAVVFAAVALEINLRVGSILGAYAGVHAARSRNRLAAALLQAEANPLVLNLDLVVPTCRRLVVGGAISLLASFGLAVWSSPYTLSPFGLLLLWMAYHYRMDVIDRCAGDIERLRAGFKRLYADTPGAGSGDARRPERPFGALNALVLVAALVAMAYILSLLLGF